MEKSDNRKEKVIPGDELAVIEEYESGKGTHIIDGQIRASIFGKTKFDNKKLNLQFLNKNIVLDLNFSKEQNQLPYNHCPPVPGRPEFLQW